LTLPTFLGVGVMRGGTTWLHELLMTHSEIFVPTRRKELHYFTLNYENGINWYEAFFPSAIESTKYKAIGEFSPSYFYLEELNRISDISTIEKFILSLRNPIERTFSYYGLYQRDRNYTGSFEDFLDSFPAAIEKSFYSQSLENYFRHFGRERLLILIHEEFVRDVENTKNMVASFLNVSTMEFTPEAGTKKVNQSYLPQRASAYALTTQLSRKLRDSDLDFIVNFGKKTGFKKLFGRRATSATMKKSTYQYLATLFEDEVKTLEAMLQIDLSCWQEIESRIELT